jgi:N-methylhydantoinase A
VLLGVDVGGTFTDAVLVDGEGRVFTAKAPTTPEEQDVGVMAAVTAVLARAGEAGDGVGEAGDGVGEAGDGVEETDDGVGEAGEGVGANQVRRFAHGMTVATNALLEGRGARTAFVATAGFTDIVELGRQARPSLYRLCEAPAPPLATPELRFGAPERTGPEGPLRGLDPDLTANMLDALAAARPEAVAVVLLHSYAHPHHERLLGEAIARRLPDAHLSLSHELVGTFREYERAATTELDAALSPLLGSYLKRLGERARDAGLPDVRVMQSSGGLTDAGRAGRHAALTVLSGPAGGVGGALLLSEAMGERDVLCFDMGGTSCDVCAIDAGRVAETAERTVAGRPVALPALDIHTVGAGGGSVAWRDEGGALRVGPRSAGATPGPACYGRGGNEPTVTDANLVLGRLPAGCELAGGVRLDGEAAWRAVTALAARLGLETVACAEGIVRVAETEMLRALRVMTVQRGVDPRRFALMPFGGAGPLHAASMAAQMGIHRVLCPRASGVLSALGLAAAAPRRDVASTVMLCGETLTAERLADELARLVARATAELDGPVGRVRMRFELRYRGQSFELPVEREHPGSNVAEALGSNVAPVSRGASSGAGHREEADEPIDPDSLREAFARAHEERYGYRDERAEIELVNVRVSAVGVAPPVSLAADRWAEPIEEEVGVVFDGAWIPARLWRGEPPPGAHVDGPAVWALPESTLLVPPGWSGAVDEHGTIVLEHVSAKERRPTTAGPTQSGWEPGR